MSPAVPPIVHLSQLVPQRKYLLVFADPEIEIAPFEAEYIQRQTEYAYFTSDGGVDAENMYVFRRVNSTDPDTEYVWYYERDFDGIIEIRAVY